MTTVLHLHLCSQQTACACTGTQEYSTLWESIFTVFNVAAAGEYDKNTYLKVGLLLAMLTQSA